MEQAVMGKKRKMKKFFSVLHAGVADVAALSMKRGWSSHEALQIALSTAAIILSTGRELNKKEKKKSAKMLAGLILFAIDYWQELLSRRKNNVVPFPTKEKGATRRPPRKE